jgi:hypothetical protein
MRQKRIILDPLLKRVSLHWIGENCATGGFRDSLSPRIALLGWLNGIQNAQSPARPKTGALSMTRLDGAWRNRANSAQLSHRPSK